MLWGKLNASSIPSTTHIHGPRSALFQPSSPKPSQPARFRNERHRNGQVPTPWSCHSLNTTPPQRGRHPLTRPSHGGYGLWHSPSDRAPPDKDEMFFPLHEREETKTILAALLNKNATGHSWAGTPPGDRLGWPAWGGIHQALLPPLPWGHRSAPRVKHSIRLLIELPSNSITSENGFFNATISCFWKANWVQLYRVSHQKTICHQPDSPARQQVWGELQQGREAARDGWRQLCSKTFQEGTERK